MLILGLQGSPRKKGNTNFLLSAFMREAERLGAKTRVIEVCEQNIIPCKEYVVCEKKGFCPIKDDMKNEIYSLLRQADVVVLASPVFFYNVTAQLKALIDRCQTLWARRYKLKLKDPKFQYRRGFMLAMGATKGKNLFEGLHLTAQYFFDAIGASYDGSLTYREIEHPGDMEKHPTVLQDVKDAVNRLLAPFRNRKKVLFTCRQNACRSQMASAFAQQLAGDRMDVLSGGSSPADSIDPFMVEAMQEKGIDMAFRIPRSIKESITTLEPEIIVTMGCDEDCPVMPGTRMLNWDIPDPVDKPLEFMRNVRDEIEQRIRELIRELE